MLLRISKKEIKIINNGIKIPKILEPMAKPDVKEKKIEYLTFFFFKNLNPKYKLIIHNTINPISFGLKKLCAKILGVANSIRTPRTPKSFELCLSNINL